MMQERTEGEHTILTVETIEDMIVAFDRMMEEPAVGIEAPRWLREEFGCDTELDVPPTTLEEEISVRRFEAA